MTRLTAHMRSNVVAYLALFFSFTGTAVAAGAVALRVGDPAGGDLTGTYPNPQLRAGSVSSGQIAPLAVSSIRIAPGAVTSGKLADGAVRLRHLGAAAGVFTKTGNNFAVGPSVCAVFGAGAAPSGSQKDDPVLVLYHGLGGNWQPEGEIELDFGSPPKLEIQLRLCNLTDASRAVPSTVKFTYVVLR